MSVFFPPINATGVMVHRPYTQRPTFSTQVQDSPTGKRYAFAEYGGGLTNFPTGPLGRFDLKYASMPDADLANLQAFFASMEGRLGDFSFIDPGGNLVAYSEDLTNASWTLSGVSVTSGAADPWRDTRAQTISGTGTATTTVISGGGASGITLTCSVYAKASTSGQSLTIGLVSIGSATVALASGAWRRISYTVTLATNAAVSMQLSGIPSGVTLFGHQCAALPGPGGYRKTPGSEALRALCRFDVDELKVMKNGPNDNSVELSIVEHF